MAKTTNERAVIDLVINGQQSKTSLKEVTIEANRAYSALVKMKEADDPAAYAQKLRDYKALNAAMREMRGNINDNSTAFSRFKQMAAGVAVGFLGGNLIETALSSISGGISKAINSYREFNAASQELSAVTGATGKDLAYLNQQAAETGPSLGKSGAEMLEAYKLMASAKPELLANKELLVETTKAAITLAQAGKIDLAEATQVTAESLNQFGEGADQANRYINVIAAGAKEGSAEINEMGAALKNSGTVAAAQGVSFEQTNAVLQSLSTIALKGGEAGTQLRNVLLTLGSGSDDTNPKVVGLQKALDNLGKKNMSTAEMTKLFGKENITAAQHIINHRDQITELTKRVTGTQEAFTQAAINNASFDHQLEVFWAKVEGLAVSIGSRLVPALTAMLSGANGLIDALPKMGGWLQKNGEWLLMTVIPAMVAYHGTLLRTTAASAAATLAETYRKVAYEVSFRWLVISEAASKAYALATGVLTGQISFQTAVVTVARAGWAAFSAVLLANPIGIVVGALGGLVAAIKYFSEHTQRALDVERKRNTLQQESQRAVDLNAKAQADLNEKIAGYNQLSKKEQEELRKTIALKETEAKLRLANAYARAREVARESAEPDFWQSMKQGAGDLLTGSWQSLYGDGLSKRKAEITEANKAQAYADAKQLGHVDELKKAWEDLQRMRIGLDKPDAPTLTGGGSSGPTDEQKKAAEAKKRKRKQEAEELERLLTAERNDALKAEQTDYEKSLSAFAEKYTKMYTLARNNGQKIKEIEQLSLVEMASIQRAYGAKQAAEKQKQYAKQLKEVGELAEKELELKRALALKDVQTKAATPGSGVTAGRAKEMELKVEQQFLAAKELLFTQHYEAMANAAWGNDDLMTQVAGDMAEKLAAIHEKQAKNEADQAEARAENRASLTKRLNDSAQSEADFQRQMATQLFSVMSTNWTSTLEGYKSFWQQSSILQKAALVAQKAWALAEIAINLSRQISADFTAAAIWNAMVPGGGTLYAAKYIAIHTAQAALQAAAVMGVSVPSFAKGGYTGSDDTHAGVEGPGGWVEFPTLFEMGQRKFIAGEAGREFVISNRALQNPVVANFARMMDVAQKTGNYSQLMTRPNPAGGLPPAGGDSPAPTGSPNSEALMMRLIAVQERTNQMLEQKNAQPVALNYRILEQYKDNLEEARIENTLN